MPIVDWQSDLSREGHKVMICGLPVAMHCHHYNINLQATLEESLGEEGVEMLFCAAEEATRKMLTSIITTYRKIKTIKSKLEIAAIIFQNCGLGILHFQEIRPEAARIISPSSHHVTGWLAKHGKRKTPGCHFTRGWIAGALEAIYERPAGYYEVRETECKMMRDPNCVFEIKER